MPRNNGVVEEVVLGGEYMGAASAEWESECGGIGEGGGGWRGGMEIWSGEIGGRCMWPPLSGRSGVPRKTKVEEEDERGLAWLGYVLSGLDWESRCSCRSEVAEEKQRWLEAEREEALTDLRLLRKQRCRRWERRERGVFEEKTSFWLTLLRSGLTSLLLKWVMCVARDFCLCVSLCALHLSLFAAVAANLFGGNPCPE